VISIYRSQPVAEVGNQSIKLTRDEYRLLVLLGMMNHRLTPREFLLDELCKGRTRVLSDNNLLTIKICRLRKKLGRQYIQIVREQGYILAANVQFV
jgi:DNA-binding response OmpR family regulator